SDYILSPFWAKPFCWQIPCGKRVSRGGSIPHPEVVGGRRSQDSSFSDGWASWKWGRQLKNREARFPPHPTVHMLWTLESKFRGHLRPASLRTDSVKRHSGGPCAGCSYRAKETSTHASNDARELGSG
ncbi:mCG1042153, partial [Mus musculus]